MLKADRRKIALIVIGLAVAAVIGAIAQGPSQSPAFESRVRSFTPVNPADLLVNVEVTNTGTGNGEASCTISAHDPSNAYHGVDVFNVPEISAGDSFRFNGHLVITDEGAAYVTTVQAECE